MEFSKALQLLLAATGLCVSAPADDGSWPHFLGPNFDATTVTVPLLEAFPEDGLPILWERERGASYACPVIADDHLVYFHRQDGKETIECLDPETGKEKWAHAYAVDYQDRYGFAEGPRSSAVIDGDRVFTAGVTAQLHCLDLKTGEVVWKRDLMEDFSVPQYFFGYGPTPFVWKDRLIVNVGGKKDGKGVCVAAFDKKTGKTLWTYEDEWGASYASPVVTTLHGKPVALVMAGGESRPSHGGLLVLDADDGEMLARYPWRSKKYESVIASTPLPLSGNRVFISECYELGSTALEFDEDFAITQLWSQPEFGLHWMMPIRLGDHLYGFAGRNPPDTQFKSIDAGTGIIAWRDDMMWQVPAPPNPRRPNAPARMMNEGLFRGSLLKAGERIFALGEDGILAEMKLTPKGPEVLQKTRLFTAREAWTLPALYKGRFYVVQNANDGLTGKAKRLICYDLRVKENAVSKDPATTSPR